MGEKATDSPDLRNRDKGKEEAPPHSPNAREEEPETDEVQTTTIEALERVVSSQGLLDDIIDGVRLGLLTITLLSLVLLALLGSSTPEIFPVIRPVWNFGANLPYYILSFPHRVLYLTTLVPKSIDEAQVLATHYLAYQKESLKTLPYKDLTIWFFWAKYLWESYLCIRQREKLHDIKRPSAIRSIVSRQKFLEANAYSLDKSSVSLVSDFLGVVIFTLKLVYNYYPLLWDISGTIVTDHLHISTGSEFARVCVMLLLETVEETIIGIPIKAYSTFIVEAKHGFNNQTIGLFFSDIAKSVVIETIIGSIITSIIVWIVHNTGEYLYLYIWFALLGITFIMISIYPTLIQPLFNKVEPLPEGELRSAIEALASRTGFPLKKLYQIDGSRRSAHSNAYMYGFFKNKRIVIFDTLIEQTTVEETCAVLGHEIGHWKMGHTISMLISFAIESFAMLYVFSIFVHEEALYNSFGFSTMPAVIGLKLFMFIYSPLSSLLYFVHNIISRRNEFQADAYAKKLGYGKKLESALIKIQIKNKGNMNPDPLYSAYHYSHPSLVERLRAIDDPNVAPKTE
ncbi:zinc metalloprotease [Mycoemilia scoparia]|uniref:Ste24 endopeptidase n=1 Tax=Mycoemilia scoparia TaxID=417184 RepID=A0A9W8DS09_9FUNG|nr:zinc metalloprotease [Mycoemilia scoparia]